MGTNNPKRDEAIRTMRLSGATLASIGARFSISSARVGQIVTGYSNNASRSVVISTKVDRDCEWPLIKAAAHAADLSVAGYIRALVLSEINSQ